MICPSVPSHQSEDSFFLFLQWIVLDCTKVFPWITVPVKFYFNVDLNWRIIQNKVSNCFPLGIRKNNQVKKTCHVFETRSKENRREEYKYQISKSNSLENFELTLYQFEKNLFFQILRADPLCNFRSRIFYFVRKWG